MVLNGIPISDDQCIGDSLQYINSAFQTLSSASIVTAADTSTIDLALTNRTLSASVINNSVTNSKLAFDGGSFAFRNKIINGNFDIWQRGTSSTRNISLLGIYLADRFGSATYIPTSNSPNGTVTTSRETTTSTELSLFNAAYYQRLQHNITSLGTTPLNSSVLESYGVLAGQSIENASQVLGKTVTLSFWARASQATKIVSESQIYTATEMWTPTICKTFDLTTQWQKFTHTYTMPTYSQVVGAAYNPALVNVNQTNPTYTPLGSSALPPLSSWYYQVDIKTFWDLGSWRAHGNAYAGTRPLGFEGTQQTLAEMQAMNNSIITNGYYDIAQVQLEEGSVATPFEVRPIGTELALCQRYYEVGTSVLMRSSDTGSAFFGAITPLKLVTKRIIPTMSYTIEASSGSFSCAFGAIRNNHAEFSFTAHYPVDSWARFNWIAEAEL